MNEHAIPEEERVGVPEQAETPTGHIIDMTTELRRRMEDLGTMMQERAKELGEVATERTRGTVDQIRYFSEEARTEAATRIDEAGHYLNRQFNQAEAYSREAIKEHPGTAVSLAAVAGFLLGMFGRRFMAYIGRG